MKKISIRELHRHTAAWIRSARKYRSILVLDRNTHVATLIPVTEEQAVNRFERWKPLRKFAAALDRPVGGTPVEDIRQSRPRSLSCGHRWWRLRPAHAPTLSRSHALMTCGTIFLLDTLLGNARAQIDARL